MNKNIAVELLGINVIEALSRFDEVETFALLIPLLELNPNITHHPISQVDHFLSISVTSKFVDNVYPKPLFILNTETNFSLKCDKALLDPPIKEHALGILSHLADMAIAQHQGILSISHQSTPLVGSKIYSNIAPREVKEIVRKKINSLGN